MQKEILEWECTECEYEFFAPKKDNGFLPDCPNCKSDYRVFEVKRK